MAGMTGTGAIAPKNSSGSTTGTIGGVAGLDTFESRVAALSIPDEMCDVAETGFSPLGSGTLRMRRVCAPKNLSSEQCNFTITCDMLAEAVSFSMNSETVDIESQCSGAGVRKIVNDYSVEISLTLYLDRIMNNPAFVRMLFQTETTQAQTQVNGKNYELMGISSDVLARTLPRFALEFTPQEAVNGDLTGSMIFPYAELSLPSGELSFSKSDTRQIQLMFNATLPPSTAPGMPRMIFGMWVPTAA